jgi:PRTRC genetic system ThiF family protein
MKYHYIHKYFLNPTHKITVNVIGIGGTGSRVLPHLMLIDKGLIALGHPGIQVSAFDADDVSEANIGRQNFFPHDVGLNKAQVSVTRMNRIFGTSWQGYPFNYDSSLIENRNESFQANIMISCVDSITARKKLRDIQWRYNYNEDCLAFYWIDIGNGKDYGQYVLSTISDIEQPSKDGIESLPNLFSLHPELEEQPDDISSPSCSLREALSYQDLFVNPAMALQACEMLWKLCTNGRINYHGGYVNMKTMQTNLIHLK